MPDPTKPGTTRAEALEEAARIADFYAVENFRLAGDTILTDPVLRGYDVSVSAIALSDDLQTSGCIHASMAHAAQNIAAAIRAAIGDHNGQP